MTLVSLLVLSYAILCSYIPEWSGKTPEPACKVFLDWAYIFGLPGLAFAVIIFGCAFCFRACLRITRMN